MTGDQETEGALLKRLLAGGIHRLTDAHLLPDEPGAYGWLFDTLPPGVPKNDYLTINGFSLLYIGIAAGESLKDRITKHHLLRARRSTLRLSLGCLLHEELGLCPHAMDRGKFGWGDEGEKKLTEWLYAHARLAYVRDANPDRFETVLIGNLGPRSPLNIRKNPENPFGKRLSRLRGEFRARAHVERNPKPMDKQ